MAETSRGMKIGSSYDIAYQDGERRVFVRDLLLVDLTTSHATFENYHGRTLTVALGVLLKAEERQNGRWA